MAKRLIKDDIDRFHDYGLYVPIRTIYMGSESYGEDGNESGVDGLLAERVIKNITILDHVSSEPITIIINNLGGDIYHGMAICDAIKSCKSEVIAKVFGYAMSMGSAILQAADKRIMSVNSRQMIHYGTRGYDGHAKDIQKSSQECLKLDKWMEKVYISRIREKHPKYTLENLQNLLDHDTYLSAQESVRIGLADKVLGE